ncbi:purine-nucleoside phosphorylase [Tepidimicrobium xylanilyticum]|uniref:Purine nucleoside phosphorylase n=1 Tax=Tepidimicrobium xylanilyticum TaxID=1123352 RepID=A0A1H3CTZ0_9FIRM|nr:purine-nucleoside phosphorylase [Tepidimicrobium xylanilyticum]GMG97737.1 purine nucleoside phosphorylase [Tepidimicrobium xylanilyticum]SDX57613.1 purine-nucleoside phosphorylase [Tepidimicrobium xylanilyticum]
MEYMEKLQNSINFIKERTNIVPTIGIIFGSGLGDLGDKIKNSHIIKYEEIPNFPKSTVEGHKGQLILGQLGNKNVVAMQGRFHYYEGYPLKDVVFPVRVMIGLGIETLIVTNAAGGVDENFTPGDLMIINDHINITGKNPLVGPNLDELGPRFLDMTRAYDNELIKLAKNVGKDIGIDLKEGVYMWFTGPSYETPAEVRLARILGASAVGMSTVPEVIVAVHQGIKVLGISCITNMAAGILDQPLSHEEVIETSLKVKGKFEKLIVGILSNYNKGCNR